MSETERKTLFGYFKTMDRWNSIFIIKMRDSFPVLRFISGKFSDGIPRNLTNVISSSDLHLRTLYLYFSTNTRMLSNLGAYILHVFSASLKNILLG